MSRACAARVFLTGVACPACAMPGALKQDGTEWQGKAARLAGGAVLFTPALRHPPTS